MVVLYSSLLTHRGPVRIQLCSNGDGWNPSTTHAALPPQAFIIIVTLGARSGPTDPQTFLRRASPRGRTQLQLVVFTVMNLRMIFAHAF